MGCGTAGEQLALMIAMPARVQLSVWAGCECQGRPGGGRSRTRNLNIGQAFIQRLTILTLESSAPS